jgi:DnaJ-class molecular chaperone
MGKKSDWLPKDKKPCPKCKGTGSAGKNAKGETIPCPSCGGFGH